MRLTAPSHEFPPDRGLGCVLCAQGHECRPVTALGDALFTRSASRSHEPRRIHLWFRGESVTGQCQMPLYAIIRITPATAAGPRSPNGRGKRLKPAPAWVRIPSGALCWIASLAKLAVLMARSARSDVRWEAAIFGESDETLGRRTSSALGSVPSVSPADRRREHRERGSRVEAA
jgi:hypothetical protein